MDDYLNTMGKLGNHAGFIGFGEHYNHSLLIRQ